MSEISRLLEIIWTNLTITVRLRLFCGACSVVQHFHLVLIQRDTALTSAITRTPCAHVTQFWITTIVKPHHIMTSDYWDCKERKRGKIQWIYCEFAKHPYSLTFGGCYLSCQHRQIQYNAFNIYIFRIYKTGIWSCARQVNA